jgi:hypothetical protein
VTLGVSEEKFVPLNETEKFPLPVVPVETMEVYPDWGLDVTAHGSSGGCGDEGGDGFGTYTESYADPTQSQPASSSNPK